MKTHHQILCLINALIASSMVVGGLTLPVLTPTAHALCAAPEEPFGGTWNNVDSRTRGIRRVQISFQCNDVVLCPVGEPCQRPEPSGFYIRPFGSCSPTDCDWGAKYANYSPTRRSLTTSFNQSFAIRNLEARIVRGGSRDGQLMVIWRTRFTDGSGRANYTRTEYFTRR